MILSKENGFAVNLSGDILDDESKRRLYPEYKFHCGRQFTPTYQRWKKENCETNMTQKEFSEKENIDFNKCVTAELYSLRKENEDNLQSAFDSFVKSHKDEIFKAQCYAIKKLVAEKKKFHEAVEQKKNEQKNNAWREYCESIRQYVDGKDVAVSTLKNDNNLSFINNLLKVGYKVRCASAGMVFLYFDGEKKPIVKQIEHFIPFEYKPKEIRMAIPYSLSISNQIIEIDGVKMRGAWRLLGYEYPDYYNEQEKEEMNSVLCG